MHAWITFNASSTSKLIRRKEDNQVSLKLLNGQKKNNNYFLSPLYKLILQEEK